MPSRRFRWPAAALLCTLLCTIALIADAAPQPVPDTLTQRLLACATCHARVDARGNPVNDSFYPRIGGKPAGYLYHQLRNFQDGRRHYPVMTYLTEHLPDAYLREIAAHFAAQAPTVLPPTLMNLSPAQRERGRQLVHEGDQGRSIPACIACHGVRLTGVQPAIPGLLGLPRDYINAQFGAWRNGVRRAHAPDCMGQVAARLSPDDVAAVSGWLAAQPMPADPRPADAVPRPLPLLCGSAP